MKRTFLCRLEALEGDRLLTEMPGTGDPILVLRNEDGVHVLDAFCPHQYAPLVGGDLCDGVLTCPVHQWRFDVQTGKGLDMPVCLDRWDAEIVGDEIWLTGATP